MTQNLGYFGIGATRQHRGIRLPIPQNSSIIDVGTRVTQYGSSTSCRLSLMTGSILLRNVGVFFVSLFVSVTLTIVVGCRMARQVPRPRYFGCMTCTAASSSSMIQPSSATPPVFWMYDDMLEYACAARSAGVFFIDEPRSWQTHGNRGVIHSN